jgi:cell division protein FtsI (penicillin-binding protein 3)
MGYGYAIEMPPIRILALYNAVANGGRMVAPRLVKQVLNGDEVVEEFPTQVLVDKICSDPSLAAVRECLEETALTGTTKSFFRDTLSLRVASKTGTANVAQDGQGRGVTYDANYYLGSVVAYFPAENPKYTVLTSVLTNSNRGRNYYGAALAGPVVRDVVNYIFYRDEEWHSTVETDVKRQVPVKVKGGSIEQVRRVADKFSPRISFTDRNGWGEARMDTLRNVDVKTIELGDKMPNVVGMGLKDALYILESRGLEVSFTGRGAVQRQSIAAGQRIKAGQRVSLQLK